MTEISTDKVLDSLFDADLKFGSLIIKNFSPKSEYELNGLWGKMLSRLKDYDYDSSFSTLYDALPFEIAEKVASWLETNSNVNEILIEKGDIMKKVQLFFEVVIDYNDYKKKLKK